MARKRPGKKPDVLPLPIPKTPWDRSLRVFLEAADAAFDNARGLADDAALLARQRRYARAVALAVTGLEEAGKGLILWLIGLGRVKESHREVVLKALRSRHELKQASAAPLQVVGELLPLVRVITSEIPAPRRRPRSWEELGQLLRPVMAELGERLAATIDEEIDNREPPLAQRAKRAMGGALERQRRQGLYTDLDGSTIRSPSAIRRSDAQKLIRDLRACLRAIKPLGGVAAFPDEGMDAVVAMIEMHRTWTDVEAKPTPANPPAE